MQNYSWMPVAEKLRVSEAYFVRFSISDAKSMRRSMNGADESKSILVVSGRFRCSTINEIDCVDRSYSWLRFAGAGLAFKVCGNSFLGKPVSSKPKDLKVSQFVFGLLSIMSAMRLIQLEPGPICFTRYQMTAINP
ncbi:hypothetical protein D3C85_1459630 [compost metagenome]